MTTCLTQSESFIVNLGKNVIEDAGLILQRIVVTYPMYWGAIKLGVEEKIFNGMDPPAKESAKMSAYTSVITTIADNIYHTVGKHYGNSSCCN